MYVPYAFVIEETFMLFMLQVKNAPQFFLYRLYFLPILILWRYYFDVLQIALTSSDRPIHLLYFCFFLYSFISHFIITSL
ncbi:hypothetical protein ACJX0J_011284, partial [Zea mays]